MKVVYKSFCTATCNGPNPNVFPTQQVAGLAAGKQNKFWQYTELFYREQGQEDTGYVNEAYLTALARQITGLNLATWQSDRNDSIAHRPGQQRSACRQEHRRQRHADADLPGTEGRGGAMRSRAQLRPTPAGDKTGLMSTAVSTATPRRLSVDAKLRIAIGILSLIGIGIGTYLTYTHYAS